MLQGLDAYKINQEARTRWLKPIEVLTILQNHASFRIMDENPDRPPSGSLFLFNRRVLRNFRIDGHLWRRKGNGKTIAEAHERLKIANNDVLNCYYARGEKNSSFQRRTYWMLDPAYRDIVLVHYREVKEVIITGDFLWNPTVSTWAVSFGNTEVPLEIIQQGVIRCHTPQHIVGKVNLFITNGNGEQCSEGEEFEFLKNPDMYSSSSTFTQAAAVKSREEQLLLIEFVKLLFGQNIGALTSRHDNNYEFDPMINLTDIEDQSTSENTMNSIVQELLKDKFEQWLSSKKIMENSEGVCLLSKQDQCVIHMISELGYDWALKPILNSGLSVNYRDTIGWTALHWATRFGREKMVAALLAAGASAGAVSHSTSQDPVGKTPASIASSSGHKGLTGYISEAELTSHLCTLATGE